MMQAIRGSGEAAVAAAAQRPPLPDRRGDADAPPILERVPRCHRGGVAGVRTAMVRVRFHLWESGSTQQMVQKGGLRGSHGVILKAADEPEVVDAIDHLVDSGVPVVTYTTDVPTSSRCGYVGIDNHSAGTTAAYLMRQWLGDRPRTS